MQPEKTSERTGIFSRWSCVSLRAQGVAVLAFPMAVLFATLFTIYWAEGDVRTADSVVGHAYDTRAEIMQLHSSLLDAEAAESGYQATHQERFLSASNTAQATIRASLEHLPGLIADTPAAHAALQQIQRLSGDELRLLSELRTDAGAAEREKALMGELQAQL